MKEGFVETIRINTLGMLPPYMENEERRCLSVGHVKGKYGILTDEGTELLPFQYDNIVVRGFGLLQLVRNGRYGLVHLMQSDEDGTYRVVVRIRCEYDLIDAGPEGVTFLRKQGMHSGHSNGSTVRAYLAKPRLLTTEYAHENVLSQRYGRGLLAMEYNGWEDVYDVETGEILTTEKNVIALGGYETADATVIQRDHDGGYGSLLRIEKKKKIKHVFKGTAAFAVNGIDEDGEPEATGFIVETENGFEILDERLRPMTDKTFAVVSVGSVLEAVDYEGDTVVIEMKKQRLQTEGD